MLTALLTVIPVAVLLLLYLFAHFWPAVTPFMRHVDPKAEAEQHPLPNYMMMLVSGAFDDLIGGNYTATLEKLKILGKAYIPERYRFVVEKFSQLLNDTSELLADVEGLLDKAEALIGLGKGETAKPLLWEASVKLASANITYAELRDACEELAKNLQLPPAEMREKVKELGKVIEELYTRLMKLLKAIEEQKVLEDSFLTINVEPLEVWTGGVIEVEGRLYGANGSGLGGKNVQLYVDGAKLAESITLEDGWFQGLIRLPYIYKTKIAVQARYTPQDLDSKIYKPAASNIVEVRLLYIKPKIIVETVGEALPGKTFTIKGRVEAEGSLPYNHVNVSWANLNLTLNLQNEGFSVMLYTPEDIVEGEHPLRVEAPAWKVYAPTQKTIYVKVQRLPLNVQVHFPSIILAGFPSTLNGKIFYGGEQFNVTIRSVFAGQSYTTSSSGEFSLNFMAPLTVLTGYQNFEVYVSPTLPWYRSATFRGNILVVNPFTFMFPFGIVSILALTLSRSRGKLAVVEEASGKVEVKPGVAENQLFAPSGLEWLLDLYWQAVVLVASLTGVDMKPSTTIREYLMAVKPRLGDFRACFEVLTDAAEKALYSRALSREELEFAKKAFEELRLASVKV